MKHVGQILQSARLERQLSIEDMALRTRIQKDTIAAIEQGDASALPAEVYLRGFIRSMANELKLDGHALVAKIGQSTEELGRAEDAEEALHSTRYARPLGHDEDLEAPLVNAGHLVLAIVALSMLLGAWLLVGSGQNSHHPNDPRSGSDKPVIQQRVDAV